MAQIYPLHILIASLAGWMNRQQAEVLEYLIEENRVLKEQVKGRRLRLNDDQRGRLAAKGKRIGRRLLMQVATIVTPDTILRWHRQLIRAKWTYQAKRVGRPGIMKEIRELILRFARENCGWGYCRIEGALRNLGHHVSPSTIRNVLKQHGIKPAPDRPTTWRAFLENHWDQIAGTDFFTTAPPRRRRGRGRRQCPRLAGADRRRGAPLADPDGGPDVPGAAGRVRDAGAPAGLLRPPGARGEPELRFRVPGAEEVAMGSPRTRAVVLSFLGVLAWAVAARFPLGLGRDVGGERLLAAYTVAWVFAWPLLVSCLASVLFAEDGRARLVRLASYAAGPVLFALLPAFTPYAWWKGWELEEVRFNYFGELLFVEQFFKAAVLTAVSAVVIELLRHPLRRSGAATA